MNLSLNTPTTIAIADDHPLMRMALYELISKSANYFVNIIAGSGEELIEAISKTTAPDIVVLDLKMAGMDGFETLAVIRKKFKNTKVLIFTISNDHSTLLRIVEMGANGYISKNAEPAEILIALDRISEQEQYFSDAVNERLSALNKSDIHKIISSITPKEFTFLKYACTGMSYKEIAAKMYVGRFTVDDYRNSLYQKLNIESRAELVLFALKHKLVEVEL
ncbi:MAG: response regulator transcription factor [Chitinophagaceae bacterium]|nr:response regulator transcription factor [Chitinophagaceae bacterium]